MNRSNALSIFIDTRLVGHLWLDERRQFCFHYTAKWVESGGYPLSLSLPLTDVAYLADESHAFFANLLPEGRIREVIARRLGVSSGNDFGILQEIGGECAGAVSLFSSGTRPAKKGSSYHALTDSEFREIVLALPRRPLLAGEEGIRLSLAGVQKKLPLVYKDERFYISHGNAPTTHIIKPPITELESTVENEAFCMRLAAAMGLPVPFSFVYAMGALPLFVIERYDRVVQASVKRVHQEDFCQALNVLPEFKYEFEGGPSLAACARVIKEHSAAPAKDLYNFIRWVIFNYLIGNCDSHAKNISLLLEASGPVLAPFYDLLSTRVYPGLSTRLAMRIGGEYDPRQVKKGNWEVFAAELGVKSQFVIDQILDMCREIQVQSTRIFKESTAIKCDVLYRVVELVHQTAEDTEKRVR